MNNELHLCGTVLESRQGLDSTRMFRVHSMDRPSYTLPNKIHLYCEFVLMILIIQVNFIWFRVLNAGRLKTAMLLRTCSMGKKST